ncbi:protein kinase [Noviherbaspirillum sp. L7-7A]|uniref:bifunctional protein-serine/threonine kinase/phosphatase n=1 Tax=Noviherbaspirillum sp. L7-7A TaxID=2850560 RepID=UPI001C2BAC3B|nr:bifunctional protein-serine/threonine kinase/phosphatase [Noviherbaspirillum sp. L7-7A]MBV0881823.1 protein kinase [Noviherbaspirillum sp. L7-7A]
MTTQLQASIGQHSDRGRKEINQDFHGAQMPKEPLLATKGIAVALADGISSSDVSQIASQAAVTSVLEDYYCTSEAWSVKTSVEKVLVATNSWLHAQSRQGQHRYDPDRGYVCTLSALVVKSATAYLFHVGDSRIYQLRERRLEQLTCDHRLWVSRETSYLSRALGMNQQVDIDFHQLQLETGDLFMLATDGVYEHVDAEFVFAAVDSHGDDLDHAARLIVAEALRRGSADNLTVQLVRIDALPAPDAGETLRKLSGLAPAPVLAARMDFDGYTILREVRASSRSHIYLAQDKETGELQILKTPSVDRQGDPAYLESLLMEEWIARRINNAHVLKAGAQTRKRNYLYVATEFIEGQTLAQWMRDNPRPDLATVRGLVGQIARGLLAFHRLEMLHQDLRPENIMIDASGTVKIIDFGSTRVAGLTETAMRLERAEMPGTAQYAAPEYFLGERGTPRSDLYSLGVIAYQLLTGRLPYGAQVAKATTRAAQRKLQYRSVLDDQRDIPAWIDETLRRALQPDSQKRYQELSEFLYDLHHPNKAYLHRGHTPLVERNPVLFWKGVSLALALALLFMTGFVVIGGR